MLLGQNVNSYNGGENYGFASLLRDINKIEGINIVRFMSPHPKDFTDDVIDAIADCKSVCKLIHLPLQSGSTKVLKDTPPALPLPTRAVWSLLRPSTLVSPCMLA